MRIFACLRIAVLLVLSLDGTVASAQDGTPAKWTTVGCLQNARVGHTATLLRDGRVLITGGYATSDELASAELYDPSERTCQPTGTMVTARTDHTATLLTNGLVLVAGGQCRGQALNSAELYDPATGMWTSTGSMHLPRSYHTATLLANGQVLVAGGSHLASPPVFSQGIPPGGASDVSELYDPGTGAWTITDSLQTARYCHSATRLNDGKVLVAGGYGVQGMADLLASAEVYDPTTKTWSETGSLPQPLIYHTATLLHDGDVLVAGGKTALVPENEDTANAEIYQASTGTWKPTASLDAAVAGHTATLLPDGRVLVIGGTTDPEIWSNSEIFDTATETWHASPGLNRGRSLPTATLLADGQIFVTGGIYAAGSPAFATTSAEVYNLPSPSSSGSEPVPPPKTGQGRSSAPPD